MYEEQHDYQNDLYYQEQHQVDEQRVALYLAKVMGWMCVGLITTLVVCFVCLSLPGFYQFFYYNPNAMYGVVIAQLVLVLAMSFSANRVSAGTATVMFMLYAAMTGVTFTVLYFLFELSSLIFVFGFTALIFVSMSVYGFATKRDLTKIGTLALFGLMGIIVGGVVNLLVGNSMLDLAITCIGIVIFIALIAYDTQRIKDFYIGAVNSGYDEDSSEVRKMAIFGALTLYLDFINLFLKLLRLLGRRRN